MFFKKQLILKSLLTLLPSRGTLPLGISLLFLAFFIPALANAQILPPDSAFREQERRAKAIEQQADTNSLLLDRLKQADKLPENSLAKAKDSSRVDTLKKPVGDIKTTVKYQSKDSMIFDVKAKTFYLFNKGKVDYGDISLTADRVKVNWDKNIMESEGAPDSAGKVQGIPLFVQGQEKYVARKIRYNFKNKKGYVTGIVTQQGEGYLHGEKVKRNPDNSFFVDSAKYTTCNLEKPHFHIQARKIKMLPNDKLIAGPFNLYIADIPTPLGFLFGIFPTPKKQSAGIVFPTYGETPELGFFLRDGGFYFPVKDYAGVKLTGGIYSRGSYQLGLQSNYKLRYQFQGNLDLRYFQFLRGEEGLQTRSTEYSINWAHSPQTTGPGQFTALVNINSSNIQQRLNTNNQARLSAQFTSSVGYNRTPVGKPFNYSLRAEYRQNIQTGTADISLPNFSFGLNRQQPFASKTGANKTWYHKLGITYNFNATNTISNTPLQRPNIPGVPRLADNFVQEINPLPVNFANMPALLQRANLGAQHTIPITTTFNVFKYINVSPSINYSEFWFRRSLRYTQINDSTLNVDTLNRPSRAFNATASINANTRIYGTFFVRRGRLEAIRHILQPSIGFTFAPDLSGSEWGMFEKKTFRGREVRLSNFLAGGNIAGPSPVRQGVISFGISNQVEMKLKAKPPKEKGKTDTVGQFAMRRALGLNNNQMGTPPPPAEEDPNKKKTPKFEKKPLLSDFSINSAYNIYADSFNLANFNFTARSRLFDKVEFAITSVFDPYQYEPIFNQETGQIIRGRRTANYRLTESNRLGQFTTLAITASSSLNPKTGVTAAPTAPTLANAPTSTMAFIPSEIYSYVDFKIPWNLAMSVNFIYGKTPFSPRTLTQTVNFSGDVSLTEKWKIGFNSGYDFVARNPSLTSLQFYRDLHCWQMRLDVTPFGQFRQFNFTINAKASMLQDLKLQRQRSFIDR